MTKVDIFSGFLGAGKTTLIKKLIEEAYGDEQIVLIENAVPIYVIAVQLKIAPVFLAVVLAAPAFRRRHCFTPYIIFELNSASRSLSSKLSFAKFSFLPRIGLLCFCGSGFCG